MSLAGPYFGISFGLKGLAVLVLVWLADSAAYFAGRAWGDFFLPRDVLFD